MGTLIVKIEEIPVAQKHKRQKRGKMYKIIAKILQLKIAPDFHSSHPALHVVDGIPKTHRQHALFRDRLDIKG